MEGVFLVGVGAGLEGGAGGGFRWWIGVVVLLLGGAFWGALEQGGVGLSHLAGVPTVDGFLHEAVLRH